MVTLSIAINIFDQPFLSRDLDGDIAANGRTQSKEHIIVIRNTRDEIFHTLI